MLSRKKITNTVHGGGFLEVLRIALPLILSCSCHAINMFMDRLMLARYSKEAVAAAFTGGLTNFTMACLFVGTIGYTGTFVAQYEGANHREFIGKAVWQGLYLALAGGACLATGLFWAGPLFQLFKHDPQVTVQEIIYFEILCKGAFIFLLSCAISSFWTGRGKTTLVLLISVIITLFNLPLNYMLIFGKWGAPELGTAGAAWGTILSELIGLVIYLVIFFLPSSRRHFCTHHWKIDFTLLKRMLYYGLPNGIQLALDLIAFNVFSVLLGCYGVAVHEASSITFGIHNIAFCPIMGIGMTASILVGQGIGAENVPLAKKSVRSSLILVTIYSILMIVLFTCFQDLVLSPFVRPRDPTQFQALEYAKTMLYLISIYIIFDGGYIIFANAVRGAGDTKFSMYVIICESFCFAVPCVILFCLEMPWWSLWLVMLTVIPLLFFVFLIRYLGGKWTKMRVIDVSAAKEEEIL